MQSIESHAGSPAYSRSNAVSVDTFHRLKYYYAGHGGNGNASNLGPDKLLINTDGLFIKTALKCHGRYCLPKMVFLS